MQSTKPIPNQARTDRTRSALKAAMRAIALEQGYANAGTPQIVALAGVTRGALYHHYADKRELFRAVIEDECAAVAHEIERQSHMAIDPLAALRQGADAYIDAMAQATRTQLILVEAPAVLGRDGLQQIEGRYAQASLRDGLQAAMRARAIKTLPLVPLQALLNAMFDAAALCIQGGVDATETRRVIHALLQGLAIRKP